MATVKGSLPARGTDTLTESIPGIALGGEAERTVTLVCNGGISAARLAVPELGATFSPTWDSTAVSGDTELKLYCRMFAVSAAEPEVTQVTLRFGTWDWEAGNDDGTGVTNRTLSSGTETASILEHPSFKGTVTGTQLAVCKMLLEGVTPFQNVRKSDDGDGYELCTPDDDDAITVQGIRDSWEAEAAHAVLYDLILAGTASYERERLTFTKTTVFENSTEIDDDAISALGKIDSPSDLPAASGLSWRKTGIVLSKSGAEKWTLSETWSAAPAGEEWDETVYGTTAASGDSDSAADA